MIAITAITVTSSAYTQGPYFATEYSNPPGRNKLLIASFHASAVINPNAAVSKAVIFSNSSFLNVFAIILEKIRYIKNGVIIECGLLYSLAIIYIKLCTALSNNFLSLLKYAKLTRLNELA